MAGQVLYVQVVANVTGFAAKMGSAAVAVESVGRAAGTAARDVEKLAATSQRTRNVLSNVALVAGGALALGIAAGVKAAVELEQEMRNVATISEYTREHFEEMTQAVIDMSKRLPQSAQTLAEGLYDIVSSGQDGKDALLVLEAAASSASAGLTDTATAARAISAVLNAYGLSAQSASDVSDILFQTVNKGVTTFEEAANSIGFFAGTAAAAKVPFDDVASAFAAITLSGYDASESATRLNQLLAHLLNPSVALSNALSKLGYSSGAAALQADGLHGVITKLAKSQGTAADTAIQLFHDIRAAGGYMALTAANGKNYAATYDAIANEVHRAEAAHKALAEQQKSAAYQMNIVKNQASAVGIEFAQSLLPALKTVLGELHDFLAMWEAIPGPIRDALGVIGMIGAAVLVAGGVFLRFKPQIDEVRASLAAMRLEGSRLPGAISMVGKTLGVVGAALTIGTIIYGRYAAAKEHAKEITDDFVAALKAEAEGQIGATDASIIQQLVQSGDLERLQKLGVQISDVIEYVKGNRDVLADVFAPISESDLSAGDKSKLVVDLAQLSKGYSDARVAAKAEAQAQQENDLAVMRSTGQLSDFHSMLTKTKTGTYELSDAQKALQKTLDGMVDPATAVSNVLKTISDGLGTALDAATSKAGFSLSKFEASLRKTSETQRQFDADLTNIANRGAPGLADALREMGAKGVELARQLADGSQTQLDRVKHEYGRLAPDVRQSLAAFTRELEHEVRDQQRYASNLAHLAATGRYDLVQEFEKLGPEAAPLVAQAVHASDKELAKLSVVFGRRAELATDTFDAKLQVLAGIARQQGHLSVQALAQEFTHGDITAMENMLRQIRQDIIDIPTQKKIDILLGQVPTKIEIPVILHSVGDYASQVQSRFGFATGGEVDGPGTGTSDSIIARVSKGEFIVNARQAARYRPVLNAINNGADLPGFARGGSIVPRVRHAASRGLNPGASSRVIDQAIEHVQALADAWQDMLDAIAAAEQRAGLVQAIHDARAQLAKARKTKTAADDKDAVRAVADAEKQLADFDRQAANDARRRHIEAVQARLEAKETIATNREQWKFEHMSAQQQLKWLDEQMAKTRRYSDEWMNLAHQREEVAQSIRDKEKQAAAAAKDAVDALKQQQADLLSTLNGLLDQRDEILASEADAWNTYNSAVAEASATMTSSVADAISSRVDALLQTTRGVDIYADLFMRNTDLDLANRTLDELGLLTDAMQAYVTAGTDIGSVTYTITQQTQALQHWSDGLNALRAKGLSESAISALGLDTGPDKLAQVQAFQTATVDQVKKLNDAVAQQNKTAQQVASYEEQKGYGDVGRALLAAQAQYNSAVASAWSTLQDALAKANDDLSTLGKDGSRSLADAIAEGLASGIPGIIGVVNQILGILAQLPGGPTGTVTAPTSTVVTAGTGTTDPIADASRAAAGITTYVSSPTGIRSGTRPVRFATYDVGGVLKPGYTLAFNGTGRDEHVVRTAPTAGSTLSIGSISVDARGAQEGVAVQIRRELDGFVDELTHALNAGVGGPR